MVHSRNCIIKRVNDIKHKNLNFQLLTAMSYLVLNHRTNYKAATNPTQENSTETQKSYDFSHEKANPICNVERKAQANVLLLLESCFSGKINQFEVEAGKRKREKSTHPAIGERERERERDSKQSMSFLFRGFASCSETSKFYCCKKQKTNK